jgi:RimJ/RimL family protein N-acetyltransferase
VLNADAEVMRYFPAPLDRAQSDALIDHASLLLDERGWGLWAVEVVEGTWFVGFVGLNVPRFEAPFTPAVEIGWRLAPVHWGRGYATEAARAVLAFGFDELELKEVSFTHAARAVGQRYSRPVKRVSFSKAWYASIRRTVPERERITSECVSAPSGV